MFSSWLSPLRDHSPRTGPPARRARAKPPRLERLEDRTVPSIVSENQLPGSPASVWDTDHSDDYTVRGYVPGYSVNHGQTVTFKIEMLDPVTGMEVGPIPFHIQIFRMGYYQGNGAHLVLTANNQVNQVQPFPQYDLTTGLVDAGNWHASFTWQVPSNATSGVYFAKVTRDDGVLGTDGRPASNHIVFVVRDDSGHSDILLKTSDATWQAYDFYGGSSLYYSDPTVFPAQNFPFGRGYQVSYNRPFQTLRATPPVNTQAYPATSWVFYSEYPLIRFLESNGYNVSYFGDIDAQRTPSLEMGHKILMTGGHDEYWSQGMRDGFQNALARGVNLAFMSGNELFERTFWLPGIGGSSSNPRTLVCYKDSFDNPPVQHSGGWTGTWDDNRHPSQWTPNPENGITGEQYGTADTLPTNLLVPWDDGKDRFWRNTNIAGLRSTDPPASVTGAVGREWNFPKFNGYQPPGLWLLSNTLFNGPNSGVYPDGVLPQTHALVEYRDVNGALVFSAGDINFVTALDSGHDAYDDDPPGMTQDFNYITPVDQRVRQAMVNLFVDMANVQPGSLQSGLVRATQIPDTGAAPNSVITSPANGATVHVGQAVTISGTATSNGNGVIAGVEVYETNSNSYTEASGHTSWSLTWTPTAPGTVQITSLAVTDNGNLELTPPTITVNVTSSGPSVAPATSSPSASVFGQAVTLQAAVTNQGSQVTNGSVTFRDGTAVLGTVPVNGQGVAALTTHTLGAATHNIQMIYSNSDGSLTGYARLVQVVNQAPLTIRAHDAERTSDDDAVEPTADYVGLVDGSFAGIGDVDVFIREGATRRAGAFSITPTGDSSGNYQLTFIPATLTVHPGATARFQVAASTTNPVVGQTFDVTVTALDSFGNVATGYLGNLWTWADNGDGDEVRYEVAASDHGSVTFHVTLWNSGALHLYAGDDEGRWGYLDLNASDQGGNQWG
jgi:hypothetical protein